MRTGLAISSLGHAAALLWGLIAFSANPLDHPLQESMPVDIISKDDFSKLTMGARNAQPSETPKQIVEKIAEKKPVEDVTAKVSEKKEIAPTQSAAPPPPQKSEDKAEKKAESKPDPIAEALKKDEAKKQAEAKPAPLPPKKPQPHNAPKFDAAKVAALLDKRTPQRQAAAGDTLSATASLGAPAATAAKLSQSELDALRARLMQLWNPPVGIQNPEDYIVRIRIQLGRDGRLTAPPQVLTSGRGVTFDSARDSAVRAIFRGQPFDMLRQETYDQWKDIEVTFDPREMFRG
jgi:outer membrane biosynthesis protein TonB